MKKTISIIALALIVAACGGSTTTGANDSTAVVTDTVTVQSVNPGVEGQVPTDSVK
jgi:ABC-type glycerol-3-phosphate transport system substrate-binding protein